MSPLIAAVLVLTSISSQAHQRGIDLYKQQKYADAVAALEEAVKSEDPRSPEYKESVLFIGQSYFMLSQAPKAIPWLEKVSNVNEANYMLGYAYLQAGQLDQSEAAFARLFQLKADSAAAHLVAAQMMMKKEYEEQAVKEANSALALDAKIPEAHFVLGEVEISRGRLDEGIADLEKELANNASFAMAWYRLGDAYTRKQNWEVAIPHLQRAVWLNPDFSGPYILLGRCYFKQHNFENAEGILRRALLIDPNNHAAIYLLGQTLSAAGKKEEAKIVLDKLRAGKGQ